MPKQYYFFLCFFFTLPTLCVKIFDRLVVVVTSLPNRSVYVCGMRDCVWVGMCASDSICATIWCRCKCAGLNRCEYICDAVYLYRSVSVFVSMYYLYLAEFFLNEYFRIAERGALTEFTHHHQYTKSNHMSVYSLDMFTHICMIPRFSFVCRCSLHFNWTRA